MRSVSAIAAAGLGLVATHVSAAGRLPLEYSAPPRCLDRAAFLREVEQRLPRATIDVRSLRVAIEPGSQEFVARLAIADSTGAVAEREINGARCDEVASAMAIVVALVLSELAGQKSTLPPPRPAPETRTSAPASTQPGSELRSSSAGSPAVDVGRAPTGLPAAGPDSRTPSKTSSGLPWRVGVLGTATGGMAPDVAWGGFGYVELGGWARPAVRLNLGARAAPSVARGPGRASFDWLGGRLDGCWPILAWRADFTAGGCGTVEAGVLRGRGEDIDTAYSTLDPWLALGLSLRPSVRTGRLTLQADFGPTFPIFRRTFVFGTKTVHEAVVHEVPYVSWQAGVGAGVEL